MKKHFLITLLLMAFAMAATAQNKKIAILETVVKEGNVPYGIRLQLRSNLTYAISNTPGYEGYDRVDMSQIIGEHDFQRTGMVSDEQIRQLGEMTGASSILVAEAAVYDKDNIIITAKILNVETASVERAVPPQISSTNPREMQKACEELADKLLVKAPVIPEEPRINEEPQSVVIVEEPKEKSQEKPLAGQGILTRGQYFYYLGEQRISDEQYMELIYNCPESKYYYEKGLKQTKTGKTFLLWVPVGGAVTGAVIGGIVGIIDGSFGAGLGIGTLAGAFLIGIPSALVSIPFYISGSVKKNNAYKVYNQYCSQPTATLSFGSTANGIGICLSF